MYADPYAQPHTIVGGQPAAYPTYVPTYEVARSSHGSRFKSINCCALLCALTIFAVLIATATVCWYHNNETWDAATTTSTGTTSFELNSTRSCYDLEGVSTENFVNGGSRTATFTEYDSTSSVWSIMKLIQAFVLIGLILAGLLSIFIVMCFADSVRNRLLFMSGMNTLRVVLLLISLLILVALVICFLAFIGITNAFNDDMTSCTQGFCRRFADSTKEDRGTATVTSSTGTQTVSLTRQQQFGPDAGWFLVLALIPIAIILCILVVLNKFPIPVDSVGSGEAL